MSKEHTNGGSDRRGRTGRRAFIRSAVAGTALVGGSGMVAGTPGNGPGEDDSGNGDGGKGFPPEGVTEYGDGVDLGDGEVRTFTTETPSGEPKYHGVEFERSALEGLPNDKALGTAIGDETDDTYDDKYGKSGEALTVHFKNSLEFFVPFPDAEGTPFTFLGLNWNPGGHPGGVGAWEKPHFDIHFNTLGAETVDAIEGPQLPPYDEITGWDDDGVPMIESALEESQIPADYDRSPPVAVKERYITDMGEHTAPVDAPELPDAPDESGDPDAFSNTLIQGFVGVDDEGDGLGDNPRLAFVEPMITKEFLKGHTGTEEYEVPQPAVYPYEDTHHPTGYSVRDVPSRDSVVVAVQDFEEV